jgi:hypothetical protein
MIVSLSSARLFAFSELQQMLGWNQPVDVLIRNLIIDLFLLPARAQLFC